MDEERGSIPYKIIPTITRMPTNYEREMYAKQQRSTFVTALILTVGTVLLMAISLLKR